MPRSFPTKPFTAPVARLEAVLLDRVLLDRHRVAAQSQGVLDLLTDNRVVARLEAASSRRHLVPVASLAPCEIVASDNHHLLQGTMIPTHEAHLRDLRATSGSPEG